MTTAMRGDGGCQIRKRAELLELTRAHDRQQTLDRAFTLLAPRPEHNLPPLNDYRNGPPGAGSVTCVIEVADNSLRRDVGVKWQMYAHAGIGQYVVVDLVHDVVLDHRQPSGDQYQEVASLRAGDDVELRAGDHGVTVPVSYLLP